MKTGFGFCALLLLGLFGTSIPTGGLIVTFCHLRWPVPPLPLPPPPPPCELRCELLPPPLFGAALLDVAGFVSFGCSSGGGMNSIGGISSGGSPSL